MAKLIHAEDLRKGQVFAWSGGKHRARTVKKILQDCPTCNCKTIPRVEITWDGGGVVLDPDVIVTLAKSRSRRKGVV